MSEIAREIVSIEYTGFFRVTPRVPRDCKRGLFKDMVKHLVENNSSKYPSLPLVPMRNSTDSAAVYGCGAALGGTAADGGPRRGDRRIRLRN
jgi:hypothetical protein